MLKFRLRVTKVWGLLSKAFMCFITVFASLNVLSYWHHLAKEKETL